MKRTSKLKAGLKKIGDKVLPILALLKGVPIPGASLLAMVADKIKESAQLDEKEKKNLLALYREDLKDLDSARDMNTAIQSSEFGSWMGKNIPYCIDMFICAIWGCLTVYLLSFYMKLIEYDKQSDLSGIYALYALVSAAFTQVISYHRGSSQGSRYKDIINNHSQTSMKK